MLKFENRLLRLLRKKMYLNDKAVSDIISIVRTHKNHRKLFGFLLNLHDFGILWTFPVIEQKKIIETFCRDMSLSSYVEIYADLINISYGNEKNNDAGIETLIMNIRENMKNQNNFTIKAGLSLVLLRILRIRPELVHCVEAKELVASLLFLKDHISYTSIFNHLIKLFGAHTTVPLVIALLMKHPCEKNIFLSHTLIEYAIRLKIYRKREQYEKLKAFILNQREHLGEKEVSKLGKRLLIEIGKLNYLQGVYHDSLPGNNITKDNSNIKGELNKRFVLLHQNGRR